MMTHWNRLPKEVVDAPSLQVYDPKHAKAALHKEKKKKKLEIPEYYVCSRQLRVGMTKKSMQVMLS